MGFGYCQMELVIVGELWHHDSTSERWLGMLCSACRSFTHFFVLCFSFASVFFLEYEKNQWRLA
jgi:arginine exporter protein ArgO